MCVCDVCQWRILGILHFHPFLYPLEDKVSRWTRVLPLLLGGWLASPGNPPFQASLPSTGVTGACGHAWLLQQAWGSTLKSLCLCGSYTWAIFLVHGKVLKYNFNNFGSYKLGSWNLFCILDLIVYVYNFCYKHLLINIIDLKKHFLKISDFSLWRCLQNH